ncbi:unnamed protein product [Absidia cylindrospora]
MVQRESIQTALFASSIAVIGYFARNLIHENLTIVGPHLKSTCQVDPLTFTNYAPVDRMLCILVIFFQRALDDYMGLTVTRVLLGLFGTVQAIMAIEGSRNGYSRYHIMAWFMFWGMLANGITIAIVSSLFWMPLFVLTSRSFDYNTKNSNDSPLNDDCVPTMVAPARSSAILISLVLAFGIPSVLMTSSLVAEPDSWLSLQIIAGWQFCPIFIQILYTALTWILTPLLNDDRVMPLTGDALTTNAAMVTSSKTTTSTATSISTSTMSRTTMMTTNESDATDQLEEENRQRQRVRMAQSKAGVEQLYLIMAVINALIYYGSFIQTQMDGVHLKDSLILLATKTIPAAGLNAIEINQFFCAHILFLDLVVLTITFGLWSLYEDGIMAFVIVAAGTIIIGPGAMLAAYAMYRENRIQNPENLKLRGKKTN